MPRLIIIGQSPAVAHVAKKMRAEAPDWQVTVIASDGQYPYDRQALPGLIGRKVKDKDIFCATQEEWASLGVEFILDKEISRVNASRRKVFLSGRIQMEYDALIIADAPQVLLPEKKGIRKTGVFNLVRLESVRKLIKYLVFTEVVVIEGVSPQGIAVALALKELGKDVLVVNPAEMPSEDWPLLEKLLEKRGVRSLIGNVVEDIIGEGEVKALRFKSGKVIAADMLIQDDAQPDLRFLAEGELVLNERLVVMGNMRTSALEVLAIDAAMQMQEPKLIGSYALSSKAASLQADVAVKTVLGQEATFHCDGEDLRPHWDKIFSPEEVCAVQEALNSEIIPAAVAEEIVTIETIQGG